MQVGKAKLGILHHKSLLYSFRKHPLKLNFVPPRIISLQLAAFLSRLGHPFVNIRHPIRRETACFLPGAQDVSWAVVARQIYIPTGYNDFDNDLFICVSLKRLRMINFPSTIPLCIFPRLKVHTFLWKAPLFTT